MSRSERVKCDCCGLVTHAPHVVTIGVRQVFCPAGGATEEMGPELDLCGSCAASLFRQVLEFMGMSMRRVFFEGHANERLRGVVKEYL